MTDPVAIPLGGYVSGGGGTIPILGVAEPEIVSNTSLVLSLAQADPLVLKITSDGSITSMLSVTVPLISGKTWLIKNQTSEGYPIKIVGSTGTGIIIPNGAYALATTDGTNVYNGQPASGGLTVTFQPGGTASGTVFTNWTLLRKFAEAVVQLSLNATAQITYIFDVSYNSGSAAIPANEFIPGTNITITSAGESEGTTVLNISAGVTFPDLNTEQSGTISLSNIFVEDFGTTAPLATFSGGGGVTFNLSNVFWSNQHNGTASFSVDTGGQITIYASGGCNIGSNGVATRAFALTDSASNIVCPSLSQTIVGPLSLQGTAAGTIQITAYAGSSISSSHDGAAYVISATSDCTINPLITTPVTWLDDASRVAYIPATSTNWTTSPISAGAAPALIATGLDLLAAAVHAGGGGGGGITALTGDGTASGSGSVVLTVAKIHGTSVPAGGSLTTGNAAYVSGASAATYSALNLAGGAGWITGALPVANLAHGTAAQVLVTNSGASAPAWVSFAGDVTVSASGATAVGSIGGVAWPTSGTGVLTWNGTTFSWGAGGSGISALTTDVAASGTGSVTARVQALGGPSGAGGVIPMGDGTHNFEFAMATSLQTTPPSLGIVGAPGFAASASDGGAGGLVSLVGGSGAVGTGTNKVGGNGADLTVGGGPGGNSTGTAANSAGGNATIWTGPAGSGGSGTAGTTGFFTVRLGGQGATPAVQLHGDTADYISLGGPQSGTGEVAQSGFIRTPADPSVPILVSRNSSNTGDLAIIDREVITGNETVLFGSTSINNVQIGAATRLVYNAPVHRFIGGNFLWAVQTGQGTPSSQNTTIVRDAGFATCPTAADTALYSFTPPVGTSGVIKFYIVARALTAPSSGATGDTWIGERTMAFKNLSGTPAAIGTFGGPVTISDTSLSSTVGVSIAGSSSLTIQLSNTCGATLDATLTVSELIYN